MASVRAVSYTTKLLVMVSTIKLITARAPVKQPDSVYSPPVFGYNPFWYCVSTKRWKEMHTSNYEPHRADHSAAPGSTDTALPRSVAAAPFASLKDKVPNFAGKWTLAGVGPAPRRKVSRQVRLSGVRSTSIAPKRVTDPRTR